MKNKHLEKQNMNEQKRIQRGTKFKNGVQYIQKKSAYQFAY